MDTALEQQPGLIGHSGLDDAPLLERIDQTTLNEKLVAWKKVQVDDSPVIRTERAELAAQSWKQTHGEDIQIRRAKLLAHVLENIPVHIHDWQLLAGSESEDIFGVHPDIDLSTTVTSEAMNSEFLAVGSPEIAGSITEEARETLLECVEVSRRPGLQRIRDSEGNLKRFTTSSRNCQICKLKPMDKKGGLRLDTPACEKSIVGLEH